MLSRLGQWRWVALGAVAVLAIIAGLVAWRARGGTEVRASLPKGDTTRAPSGQRIVVEVLNASGVAGQARRATFELRDRGFDVIGWGNDRSRRDRTLVEDHTGKPEAAERLARVLGGAEVERGEPHPRYVDVTVHLGRAWQPPPGSFRP